MFVGKNLQRIIEACQIPILIVLVYLFLEIIIFQFPLGLIFSQSLESVSDGGK